MCGIEAFCLFLRTNCIKGFLMFRLHQDILHSILIFQKKWSHVISRDVLESFHVYQISIRFHPLCQSHSKETIFIWKNPVKRQKNKLQFNQNCWTKGVVDQPFVLSGQKKVSHAFVWSPTSALTAIYYDIHNYVFFSNWLSPRFRIHVKNIIKAWSGSVVAIIDCKNSPYFCVFKYARAVKQKERVTDIHNYVFFPNWPSPRFRIHVKNIIKAWSGSVVAIIDCKNSPYFCVLKYARAVKQKERVTDFFTDFEKKTDCFAVYGNKRMCWISSLSAESMYDW